MAVEAVEATEAAEALKAWKITNEDIRTIQVLKFNNLWTNRTFS